MGRTARGCPGATRPFAPTARSGVANNTAGAHSPFSVAVTRSDGDQNLTGLNVNTAPGFAATLKGVPYCPEAAIATLRSPGHSGRAELDFARMSGGEPDRHRHHRRRRGQPPALHAGSGLSGGPI